MTNNNSQGLGFTFRELFSSAAGCKNFTVGGAIRSGQVTSFYSFAKVLDTSIGLLQDKVLRDLALIKKKKIKRTHHICFQEDDAGYISSSAWIYMVQ
ncbi:hypothetical protein AKJ16_DCAP07799 [Drosera capensis]